MDKLTVSQHSSQSVEKKNGVTTVTEFVYSKHPYAAYIKRVKQDNYPVVILTLPCCNNQIEVQGNNTSKEWDSSIICPCCNENLMKYTLPNLSGAKAEII